MLLKLLILLFPITALANKPLPLWEAGVAVLPLMTNHYRGSPQVRTNAYPLPALTIRGKMVEAENGTIRRHIVRYDNFTFDLSFGVGLNVKSDGDRYREGMKNLDPLFEVGPMIRYYMWKSKGGDNFLNFEMPYRAVFASNGKYVDHVGYYSIPYLNFLTRPGPDTFGWSSEISLGIQYGSKGYHDRFYSVDSKYVTPSRPYYHAKGGYSGTQFSWTLSRRIGDVLLVPFFRYDYLKGAAFENSPLYKTPHYFLFGAGVVWFFAGSKDYQKAPTMVK